MSSSHDFWPPTALKADCPQRKLKYVNYSLRMRMPELWDVNLTRLTKWLADIEATLYFRMRSCPSGVYWTAHEPSKIDFHWVLSERLVSKSYFLAQLNIVTGGPVAWHPAREVPQKKYRFISNAPKPLNCSSRIDILKDNGAFESPICHLNLLSHLVLNSINE
jgi:hypothetical protein